MTTMEDDLLSRRAVDENLRRLARERMKGRKLVGVRFDEQSKSWYVVLKDGELVLIRAGVPEPSNMPASKSSTVRTPAQVDKK